MDNTEQEPAPIGQIVADETPTPGAAAPIHWQQTRDKASWATGGGLLSFVIGGLFLLMWIISPKDKPAVGPLWFGVALLSLGFWLVILGQLMHLRAGVERMAHGDEQPQTQPRKTYGWGS